MKKYLLRTIELNKVLYFIALFLYAGSCLYSNVTIFNKKILFIWQLFSYIIFLIIGTGALFRYSKNNKLKKALIFYFVFLFLIAFPIYFISAGSLLIDILVVSYGSLCLKFRDVLKIDLIIKLLITISIFAMYFLNLTYPKLYYLPDLGIYRNSFGFQHPNTIGLYFMMIYFEIIFLRNKPDLYTYLLGVGFIIAIFKISRSRTPCITIIFFLLLCLFFRIKKFNYSLPKFKNLFYIIFPSMILLSLLLTNFFSAGYPFFIKLNAILSGRLSYWALAIKNHSLTLFGNNMHSFSETVDNGFLSTALYYGISACSFFSFNFYLNYREAFNSNNKILFAVITAILVYTLAESSSLQIEYNIFLLYFLLEADDFCLS